MKISAYQMDLHWEDPFANLEKLDAAFRKEAPQTDLIVLPEMFTTGFTMDPHVVTQHHESEVLAWMKGQSLNLGAAICGSVIVRDSGRNYNRLLFVTPDGMTFRYDKRHLFGLAGESGVYTAGSERVVIDYKGFRIRPLICYDLRFPVWSRNDQAIDLYLYVANWPAARIQAWDMLLQARAIENQSWVVGVNRFGVDGNGHPYPGHSQILDYSGQLLGFSEEKDQWLHASLNREDLLSYRTQFPFLKDQDAFRIL